MTGNLIDLPSLPIKQSAESLPCYRFFHKAAAVKSRIEKRGLHWWFHLMDDNVIIANIRIRPDSRTIASGYGLNYASAIIAAVQELGKDDRTN